MQYKLFLILTLFLVALPLASAQQLFKDKVLACFDNTNGAGKFLDYRGTIASSINLTGAQSRVGLFPEHNESVEFREGSGDKGYLATEPFQNLKAGFVFVAFNKTSKVANHNWITFSDKTQNSAHISMMAETDGNNRYTLSVLNPGGSPAVNAFDCGSGLDATGNNPRTIAFGSTGDTGAGYWCHLNGTNRTLSLQAGANDGQWLQNLTNKGYTPTTISIAIRDRQAGTDLSLEGWIEVLIIGNATPTTEELGNMSNFTTGDAGGIDPINCSSIFAAPAAADTTLPIVNVSLNNTSPKRYEWINISANITDETELIFVNWSINFSTGIIRQNYSVSGASFKFSNRTQITDSRGNVLNITIYATDSSNNVQINSTIINVANTPPNGTNFVNTTGKHYNANVSRLNWTASNDSDNDALRYVVYTGTSNPPATLYYNGTDLNISTNWTEDNTYFFQIKVMDETSESDLSSVFNLTLDTGTPSLTLNISNNTFARFNQTINISIDDVYPYNLTMRIYKGSNTYYSITNSTPIGRLISIIANINLTDDGNYTIEINASDADKTSPIISDKLFNWKVKNELLSFNTSKGQGINLDIKFKGNAPPANFNSFSYFNEKGTHIDFGLNYTANATDLIPVFNVKANNMDIAYLNDSIKGHFIFHPYGIDFEGMLLINNTIKSYTAEIKKISNANYQVDIIPNETINIGDNVSFISSSVFGLNTIDITYNFVNDQTLPNIRNITPINNSLLSSSANFTANITETNADKMELWINSTGTWHLNRTASYVNNLHSNFSIFNLSDGFYKFTICANDTAGSYSCFAENYTLTIESSSLNVSLSSPANNSAMYSSSLITFAFNITKASACSLLIDDVIVGSNASVLPNIRTEITIYTAFTGNNMRWLVNCTDSNSNKANASFKITLLQPVAGTGSTGGGGGGGGGSFSIITYPIALKSNASNSTPFSASILNETHITIVYQNGSSAQIELFASQSTGSKFLDITIPLPSFMQFQISQTNPSATNSLKYWLDFEYTSKETFSTAIIVTGIRILTPLTAISLILLFYLARLLRKHAQ